MSSADPGWLFGLLCLLMILIPLFVPVACVVAVVWLVEIVVGWAMGRIPREGDAK